MAAEIGDALDALARMTYRDLEGERPLLDAAEIDFLRIPRGSLSGDERRKMEQHVTQSFYLPARDPVDEDAVAATCPRSPTATTSTSTAPATRAGSKARRSSPQVRMLTISDVFDALTANDRPYKPAMSAERALDILVREFAERGKVDRDLLDLFIAKRVYEPVLAARS